MFFFRKRKALGTADFFSGFNDCHCHVLPGVDDGVKTIDESLQILHTFENLGVCSIWLTPHVMEDIPNTTSDLQERFDTLRSSYDGKIALHLAAEYMLDGLFDQRLLTGDLLTLGNTDRQVLVETSYFNPPMAMDAVLQNIMSRGFFPVLAHPERYRYITDIEHYRRMKRMGVRFQLNLGALVGMYGRTAQRKAMMLIDEGAYNYIGTDLHSANQLSALLSEQMTLDMLKTIEHLKFEG